MRDPTIIDDQTFNDRLGRLVLVGGDLERSGLSLDDVSDMIFTRINRVNPLGEPMQPKAKKEKVKGIDKLDDLLG